MKLTSQIHIIEQITRFITAAVTYLSVNFVRICQAAFTTVLPVFGLAAAAVRNRIRAVEVFVVVPVGVVRYSAALVLRKINTNINK